MYHIVTSRIGRAFRIKEENLHLIKNKPEWKLRHRREARYYNLKTGKINKIYLAVKEIKTEKDLGKVGAAYETEFDLLFGKLSEIAI